MSHDPESCPMPVAGDAPADDALATLLADATTVAVVGASPTPGRTSHEVYRWLAAHTPYRLIPVNPVAAAASQELEGAAFVGELADVKEAIDIVVAFRRDEDIPPVADAAIAAHAGTLWMQLGIRNADAAAAAAEAGLAVVQNRCIKVEYARLRDQIAKRQGTVAP